MTAFDRTSGKILWSALDDRSSYAQGGRGAAAALRRKVFRLAAALHTGECDVDGQSVSGTTVQIGALRIGGGQPLALIGGPYAIENEKHALVTAERIVTITTDRRVPFIYKSSYDKANRSSIHGHRGPGLTEGLRILKKVRDTLGVPVLSDVHQVSEVAPAAEVLDVLQIPAFLCRQTDLVVAVARTGKPLNVKKGQFLAPGDMKNVMDKIVSVGNRSILLTDHAGLPFDYSPVLRDGLALCG